MNSASKRSSASPTRTFLESFLFALVGVANTSIDLLIFFLLVHFCQWHAVQAQVVSYTCGLLNSYILNRMVTFRRSDKPKFSEMIRFIMLNAVSCGVSVVMLAGLQHVVQSTILVKILATGMTLALNFTGSKWWVFRHRAKTQITCQGT